MARQIVILRFSEVPYTVPTEFVAYVRAYVFPGNAPLAGPLSVKEPDCFVGVNSFIVSDNVGFVFGEKL